MKQLAIAIATLFAFSATQAQQAFSLQQALRYADEHSYTLRQSGQEVQKAKARVAELIASGFPQVAGSAAYQNFIQQPVQVVPAEFFGGEQGEFAEVIFGTKQNLALDVTANQLIFDGNYLIGLKAAREFVEMSNLERQQTKQEVRKNVADAYFQVLVARENVETLEATLATLEDLKRETNALYENGLAEQTDAQQVELNYNNTKTHYQSAITQEKLAITLLKFSMGMPTDQSLKLTDSLDPFVEMSPSALLTSNVSHQDNLNYRLARQARVLQELDLKSAKSEYLPKINAFYSFQENAYRNEFNFFDSDEKYFPTRLVGVNISVPIFSSTRRLQKVKQTRLEVQQSKTREEQAREGFKVQLANSKATLKLKYKQLQNETDAVDLAKEIRRKTQIKFTEGVASSFEVAQAENQYLAAQGQYIRSLLEYLRARTSFEQLLNNL